jgi:hypothetical protein
VNTPADWYASLAGIVAAFMIAGDFGRRITGFGFALFVTASAAWIFSSVQSGATPLAVQNALLLLINLYGVWQFLLSPKNKRKIEAAEQAVAEEEAKQA